MAKRKTTKNQETDSVYLLKLILFFVLGTLWLSIGIEDRVLSLPVGLIFGLFLAHHEHFMIDKKVEYAILLAAAILSFVAPVGFVLVI